jgi:apolipoprotein N-acyltransferase
MSKFLKTYGPALVSGILLALSFPAWRLCFLAWIALVPLLYSCRDASPQDAAKRFLLAGWVFHSLLLQWLLTNFFWAGGWAFWGQQALCLFLGAYWAALALLWVWLRRRLPKAPAFLTLPVLWMAMEYGQARLFTGFGWSSLGYSQGGDLPFLQLASVGGASFLAAILTAANALIAETLYAERLRLARLAAAAALIVSAHGAGFVLMAPTTHAEEPLQIGIFQSNFPLSMKWDPEYTVEMVRNAADKSRLLDRNEPIDLFVWPESLIMDELTRPEILELVTTLTRDTGAALFTGSVRFDPQTNRSRNSSYLILPDGKIAGYYDKIHLAPFGEYVPLGSYFPFIQKAVPIISDVEPGEKARVFTVEDRTLGPLICFEVLFADMSATLRELGADFLVVVTNLGWFGANEGSSALGQEIELARMRAVETRLPLVHSANTGISGVFDPYGRFFGMNAMATSSGSFHWLRGDLAIDETMHFRCLGAIPLPEAAPRPVPWSPQTVPLAAVLLSGALTLVGLIASRLQTARKHDEG